MFDFGDIIGHTNKERATSSLRFAWVVVIVTGLLFWFGEVEEAWKWGPADDLFFLGIKINTTVKYYSLFPLMLFIDISLLCLKLYPKSQVELFLVLPLDQVIVDYSPLGLLSMAMQTTVCLAFIKYYTWNFLFNRWDILLMSFLIKMIILVLAFWYRITQMKFACNMPLLTEVNKQTL